MRALVRRETGLVLERDYPMPAPVDGEALIHVLLAGICNTDLEITRGYLDFQGVPGHEFVGVVEEVYGHVSQEQYGYLIGQRVVGEINAACHRPDCTYCQRGMPTHCPNRSTLGIVNRDGAFADYLMLPVENLHLVPEHVSDEEAVFVEPLAANFEILEQVHNDAERFALENERRVDLVVECTGSAQGLELALRLVRPRGTVILKSTC